MHRIVGIACLGWAGLAWAGQDATLTLSVEGLARPGSAVFVEVTGATPGAWLALGSGLDAVQGGRCFPSVCVDVTTPVLHGVVAADEDGEASGWLPVPEAAPGPQVRHFQVVEAGDPPRTSNVVPRIVTNPTFPAAFPFTEFVGVVGPGGGAPGDYIVHFRSLSLPGVDVCTLRWDAVALPSALACPDCAFALDVQTTGQPEETTEAGDCVDAGFVLGFLAQGMTVDIAYREPVPPYTGLGHGTVLYSYYGTWYEPAGDFADVSVSQWDASTGEVTLLESFYWGPYWTY